MNARQPIWAIAAAMFAVPCLAEDRECRWFIPATGLTVPVRCEEDSQNPATPLRVSAERSLLGLTLSPLTQKLREEYGIESKVSGVIVTQVDADSEAASQGIARGDMILQSNNATISTPEDVIRSVESATKDGRKTLSLHLSNVGGRAQFVRLSL